MFPVCLRGGVPVKKTGAVFPVPYLVAALGQFENE